MADFASSSLCMKLAMMMVSAAFTMHLFSMDAPEGWSKVQSLQCSDTICLNADATRAVQALEVIGFLCVLVALFLSLCIVLLDELKGNRRALFLLCFFSLVAGVTIIAGIGVYEDWNSGPGGKICAGSSYASTVGVMAGISAVLGGMFCFLELIGGST